MGKTWYQSFNLCFFHYESDGVSFNMSKSHLGFFFCDYSSLAHFATKLLIFSKLLGTFYILDVLVPYMLLEF